MHYKLIRYNRILRKAQLAFSIFVSFSIPSLGVVTIKYEH